MIAVGRIKDPDLADRIIGADPDLSAPEHGTALAAVERWERNAAVREDAG